MNDQIKILLIEDNPADVRLIEEYLSSSDAAWFSLYNVKSLYDALLKLNQNEYDLILLDLNLPDTTGYSTFQKLHDYEKNIPIVVLTGTQDEELGRKLIQDGAQDYLPKNTINRSLLVEVILYSIHRKAFENKINIKADEELALHKKQEELLLRIVPSAVFTVDLDEKITLWNDMAETITGFSRDEMIGETCKLFAYAPCREKCGLYSKDIQKPILHKECTIQTKDGEIKHISKNVDYLYGPEGEIIGGIESFQDITEAKSAEMELINSENKFRKMWEYSLDGFRFTDEQGIIKDVNDAYCRMIGKAKEELIGKSMNVVYSDKTKDDGLNVYLNRIVNKFTIPREEYNVRLWDNRKLWFSVSTISIDTKEEKFWISVFRDITESKKTELLHKVIYELSNAVFEIRELGKLLEEIRNIFSQLVDTTNFLVALYDSETGMLSIPFQSSNKEHYEEVLAEGTFSGYVVKTKDALLMNEEESYKMVSEGKAKMVGSPAKIWMGVPIRINNEVFGVIVIQDYEDEHAFGLEELNLLEFASDQIGVAIERIRSREQLEKSENDLRLANDTKDRFFSIIAHDLKNPFLTLKGYLEILSEDYNELTEEEIRNYILTLINVSKKTFSLLEDLLLWSRSQRGNLEIHPEKNDIKNLIYEAVAPLSETAKKKGIQINIDSNSLCNVLADSFTIKTVIRNLVSNSIKFTSEGGVITIKCDDSGDTITLSVADTGVGMKKDTVENLFRLDKKVSGKGTLGEEGTGLGLMLCKDFVEKNNGVLNVESELNKGTRMYFSLPKVNGVE